MLIKAYLIFFIFTYKYTQSMRNFCIVLLAGTFLISCKNTPSTEAANATPAADTLSRSGCFLHALNKDSTFLQISLQNGKATGKFYWLPDQKDRANGVLEGTYAGDTIRVNYHYMIEGSIQDEEKVFVWERDSISVLYGPLVVSGAKITLQKDKPLQVAIRMGKADCAALQIPEFVSK